MPRKPSYEQLTTRRLPGGQRVSPETQRIINLPPKGVVDVTPEDGDLDRERSRQTSRMRTARFATGRRYRCLTLDGRLYVVCEAADQPASSKESD